MKYLALGLFLGLPLLAAPPGVTFAVVDGRGPTPTDLDEVAAGGPIRAVWSPFGGAESYEVAVGTTPGGVDVEPFLDVGTVQTYSSPTALALVGPTYFVTVRAIISAIPVSTVTSDGAVGVAFDVFDGPGPFPNDLDTISVGAPITAVWNSFPGADAYEVAVGTSPGGVDVEPFLNVGPVLSYSSPTARAQAGPTYYVRVRALFLGVSEGFATTDGASVSGAAAAAPTSGPAPLTVNFRAQVPGVVLYEWDFDAPFSGGTKGKSARAISPPGGAASVDYSSPASGDATYTYAHEGSYEARLTMHLGDGSTLPPESILINVSPASDAPAIGMAADVLSGPAPLNVTLTASVSAAIGAYFWDLNQDGVYDAVTDGPVLTTTLTRIGNHSVSATVFNDKGVGSTSLAVDITVMDPSNDAPFMTASAAVGGPFLVGDVVPFTAAADPGATGGAIVSFHWDFDGNGEIDLITLTGNASHRFNAPGFYNGSVFVTDNQNFSSQNAGFSAQVLLAHNVDRVWLVEPQNGLRVFGNFVTLTAMAVPAEEVTGVDFFFRRVGDIPWTPVNPAPVTGPPVTEFGTHWDVTALAQGAPGYEVMAIASFGARPAANSPIVAVTVDAAAPDVLENSGSPFTKLKTQVVNPNALANLGISRDTTVQLQAGTTSGYDQMRLERRSENPHPVETNLQGLRFVPGHFRKKSLASGQKLQKPSKVTMYVNNEGDLLADGTDLNAATFKIMKFNEKNRRWEPLYNQTFNPTQKLIKAFAASTGDVGIAVVSNRTSSSSSSSSCGLAGLEILCAGAAAAILARRIRRRA